MDRKLRLESLRIYGGEKQDDAQIRLLVMLLNEVLSWIDLVICIKIEMFSSEKKGTVGVIGAKATKFLYLLDHQGRRLQ